MKPTNKYKQSENEGAMIPTFNINALSSRRFKEARGLAEREAVQYFEQRLDIERVTYLTKDAVTGHLMVSQMADAAIQISPRSAKCIDALLGAHAQYCYNKILDADERRDRR